MLYLEDLKIGDRFISREYEMTLEEVKQFASQYDPQPFHFDQQAAAQHPIFQGLDASGWHTSASKIKVKSPWCKPSAMRLCPPAYWHRWR